jgi:hypothetical protein
MDGAFTLIIAGVTAPGCAAADLNPVIALAPGPGLLFGLMLVAAIAGGYLAHAIHVPRVVGYLLAGCALNLLLHELLKTDTSTQNQANLELAEFPLNAVSDLGLGIIFFPSAQSSRPATSDPSKRFSPKSPSLKTRPRFFSFFSLLPRRLRSPTPPHQPPV